MKKQIAMLAFALVAALVLAGCGDAETPDTSVSEAPEPVVSSAPESEPEVSSQPSQEEEPQGEGGILVDDLADLDGIWMAMLNEEDQTVCQMKFGEVPDKMMISMGTYQTDGGVFYWGPYELPEPGVLNVSMQYSSYETTGDEPYTDATYHLTWADENTTAIVATLVSMEKPTAAAGTDFAEWFSDFLNEPMTLEKQAY